MTAFKGLGTYGNAAGVVTPLDHKGAQAGQVVKASGNLIRPGLFWGGSATLVTGKANMSYDVAAYTCVTTRSATAGAVFGGNDGVLNVPTTAAPGSNSRIDIIYHWHREFSLDGVDSNPVIGVVQGNAAAVPVAPSLAAFPGAIEIGRATVGAGITATTSATITQTGTFTAMAGGVIPFRNTTERDAGTYQESQLGWLVDSDQLIVYTGTAWRGLASSTVMSPSSVTGGTINPNGTITSGSVAVVRPNGVFTSAYPRYEVKFDITTASSTTLVAALSAAGVDTITGYDNQRHTDINTTSAAAQSLNATGIILGGGTSSTRHVGSLFFDTNPAATGETYFRVDTTVSPNPMTTAHGKYLGSGLQRATTQLDGLSFTAGTGNLTVNYLAVIGSF